MIVSLALVLLFAPAAMPIGIVACAVAECVIELLAVVVYTAQRRDH